MNDAVVLDETIEAERPVGEVFAYLSDFARIEEWDPAVRAAERLTEGPPRAGSEYRIDMRVGFSLHYRIEEFEPGKRMRMSVRSRFFDADEEIRFAGTRGGRTRVRYIARFHFPKLLVMFAQRFPTVMQKVGKDAMAGMAAALADRFQAPEASPLTAIADYLLIPGMLRFTRLGFERARRRWHPMSAWLGERHIVITGASAGLGLAAAEQLAARGARLTLVVRDAARGEAVAERLRAASGNPHIRCEIADMESMSSINALVDRLLAAGDPIHVLVNNAGALFNERRETSEGLEASFALLLLGPALLTERLHPLLAAAGSARVVNVLSGGMYTQRLRVNDLQSQRGTWSGAAAYSRAKRGLWILTEAWASRWEQDGIVVNAMHPGWADTAGVRSSLPEFHRITRRILRNPHQGADTITWLAAATEAGRVSGEFWLDREQHPAYVMRGTRESAAERETFIREMTARIAELSGAAESPARSTRAGRSGAADRSAGTGRGRKRASGGSGKAVSLS